MKKQPGLAGRHLYDPKYDGLSTDPQTVEEQATLDARLALSSVVAHEADDSSATYQQYLTFLSSTSTQLTSNAIHDHYHENSLWVASKANPTPYEIWGDDTMFRRGKSGCAGARLTSETSQLSQQSIRELLNSGQTQITRQALRDRFPTRAGDDDQKVVSLQSWVDGKEQWTEDKIFNNWDVWLKRILSQSFRASSIFRRIRNSRTSGTPACPMRG